MINFSRRQLAKYAADQMLANQPIADLSAYLAAALTASGMQKEVELLLSDIDQELEVRGLLAIARIKSAYPLSAELKRDLESQLKKMTGSKEVVLREQIDKNIIGGIKVETAVHSWDRTVNGRLNTIKEAV